MYGKHNINSFMQKQAKESLFDSYGELGQAKTSLLNRTAQGYIPEPEENLSTGAFTE